MSTRKEILIHRLMAAARDLVQNAEHGDMKSLVTELDSAIVDLEAEGYATPSHEELLALRKAGKATLRVAAMGHREFVYEGVRYFVGYSSERYKNGDIFGWCVYGQKREGK